MSGRVQSTDRAARATAKALLRAARLPVSGALHLLGHDEDDRPGSAASNRLRLDGRAVLVSGATGGIGEVLARRLAERGARVALMSRPSERLDRLVASLSEHDVIAAPCDVTDRDAVFEAVDRVAGTFGELAAVVAGAGVVRTALVSEQTEEDARVVIDTNLYGTIWTLQAALPHVDRSGGHLLALASIAAVAPIPLSGVYPATKAGVGELVAQLRIELLHREASAGVAYLGMVQTEMSDEVGEDERIGRALARTPDVLSRALSAEDAARAIVRAVEHRRAALVAPVRQLPAALPQLAIQRLAELVIGLTPLADELPTEPTERQPQRA